MSQKRAKPKGSFSFEITTVTSCDMGCTYCFEGKKAVDNGLVNSRIPEIKEKIKETLNAEWFKKDYEHLSIDFWGGEPTLNNTIMTALINEFQNYDNVDFHLYTNAFNESTIRKFISTIKLINDKFRLTHNGKTTSDQVLQTFDYLSKVGLKELSLKSTLPYVRYAPTLDYHTKLEDPNKYLPLFEKAIREIYLV